tara:strand:- start:844 stop:1131 length:288 start_codon:yes stop_codon:yes gene_type:complete
MAKNQFGKSVKVEEAHATYRVDNPNNRMYFEWKILKTYKTKENEDKDQYARWFTACKSPMTKGSWEYGDVYINEIKDVGAKLIDSTPSWKEVYQV